MVRCQSCKAAVGIIDGYSIGNLIHKPVKKLNVNLETLKIPPLTGIYERPVESQILNFCTTIRLRHFSWQKNVN